MKKRGREEKTVQAIQHTPMARDERPRILHLSTSLQHRLREIPELAEDPQSDAEQDAGPAS